MVEVDAFGVITIQVVVIIQTTQELNLIAAMVLQVLDRIIEALPMREKRVENDELDVFQYGESQNDLDHTNQMKAQLAVGFVIRAVVRWLSHLSHFDYRFAQHDYANCDQADAQYYEADR